MSPLPAAPDPTADPIAFAASRGLLQPGVAIPAPVDPLPGLTAIAGGRDYLSTNETATVLGLSPQTLRGWSSCSGEKEPPLRPTRVGPRLQWKVSDIRAMFGAGVARHAQLDAAVMAGQRDATTLLRQFSDFSENPTHLLDFVVGAIDPGDLSRARLRGFLRVLRDAIAREPA